MKPKSSILRKKNHSQSNKDQQGVFGTDLCKLLNRTQEESLLFFMLFFSLHCSCEYTDKSCYTVVTLYLIGNIYFFIKLI